MNVHRQPAFVSVPTQERDWFAPSATMTAGLGLVALMLMPFAGYDEIPPYFSHFINWMACGFFGATILFLVHVVKLQRAGIEQPLTHLRQGILIHKADLLFAVGGMMLAGIDMLFFMWIKPEVTSISPFWADELLANIDRAVFRVDPWRLFSGIDLTFHAWAYSFFWTVAIVGTLVWLLAQKPSFERSTSLLSYFALWSIFGPIGQYLFSSAGPIFYQRIGLGDRFAGLGDNIPEITQKVSAYLWDFYTTGELGVGAGISAMPSLHIATVAWIYLVFRGQRSRLAPLAVLFGLYIFALSVALGWHYAVDGIAGAIGAIASQLACGSYLRRRERRAPNQTVSVLQ